MKKLICIIMALVMVLGMGATAFAEELPNAEISVLKPFVLTAEEHEYMCWPGGDATVDRPLQVVMNFKANDTYEQACAGKYGKYVCDFYLEFSGLATGSVVADGCYLAGNYGTFGWIVIPVDGLEVEEGISYGVVSAYDANLTYENICEYVKDFTASIYISDTVLEANPNFTVSLSLKMTSPDGSEVITVGEPAVYTAEDLKAAPEVEVEKPATKTEVSEKIESLPNDVKEGITSAAKATEVKGVDLEAEAEKIADDITEKAAKEIVAAAVAKENSKITDAANAVIVIEPEVKVSVEEYKPAENENKKAVLVLDIEPVINIYVANDTEKELYETKEVDTAGQEVVVTIELPAGFAEEGETLYVLHTKDNGAQYEYECVVENGKISFVNKNGFSSFEVSFEQSLVVIPDAPIKETVEVIIDANKETVDKDEEQNPSTGAPIMMPVLAVAALGAAVLSKRK